MRRFRQRRASTRKKWISIVSVCFLVSAGFIGLITFESNVVSAGSTIYVGSGAGNDSATINGGIGLASDGDTVYVYSGTYYENVVVDKTINLIGEDRDATIIDGGGVSSVVCVSANRVNITGFTITNGGKGIDVWDSSNNTIINNTVSNNNRGIVVQESSNDIITHNIISNNEVGIYLWDSSNITLTNNNFLNDGVYIQGNILQHFNTHTISENNIVNGKPLYYYKDIKGIDIDGIPVGQLILANCTDFDVKNIQIDNTDIGIEVAYSTNILIANNNISSKTAIGIYPHSGILFYSSSNNTITNNHVFNNGNMGILLRSSSHNNIIANNNVSNNNRGIGIGSSSNNIITNNNILSHNSNGIIIGVSWEDNSSNNIVTGNNIANNDGFGIYITWTSYNIISNNIISNCDYGIYLYSLNGIVLPHDNVIAGNTISSNNYGCYLEASPNNNITGNNILNNDFGIYLIMFSSSNNKITNNNISNNDYGIYNQWTYNHMIYHNNFINNTNQSFDPTNNGNQWDNGYPSGGNYWSDFDEAGEGAYDDYNGQDQDILGSDGIVDNGTIGGGGTNPYVIDSDSQDNYPLIEPRDNFMFLYEGWNLISLPLVQSDTNAGVVLSYISGLYKTVQWYDTTDPDDPWKHNCTTKPQHLNDFDSIDHLIGFWIYITEPGGVLFEYSGTQPGTPQNIPLHTGWNMVGFPSLGNKNRTVGLNNLDFGVEVDAIWTFDGATQTWEAVGPGDDFEIGRGYWVHATQECVWDVPL